MVLKDRIALLRDKTGLSISQFSRRVGFKTPQAIRELEAGRTKTLSDAACMKLTAAFPDISEIWLKDGIGDMYDTSKSINQSNTDKIAKEDFRMVPLINIDSVGGIRSKNEITFDEQYVIRMMPFTEAREGDVAILQTGNSMSPTIPPGSALLIREVEDWQEYFGYGNIYVLWLRDGRRITKEIRRYDADPKNYVWCVSYNPDVADEELPRKMIVGVWKVIKYIADFGW